MKKALLLGAVLCFGIACACRDSLFSDDDRPVYARNELCVTSGQVRDGGVIDGPSVRAVVPASAGDEALLRFTYGGPSLETRALASGQVRRQVGIKLRAEDSCNVLYAMWRFEPKPSRIEVSAKRNPDSTRHGECGNNGYTKFHGSYESLLLPPEPGREYQLRARLQDSTLSVALDGEVVWRGRVGNDALELNGLAGFRTDNVALQGVSIATTSGDGSNDLAVPARCKN